MSKIICNGLSKNAFLLKIFSEYIKRKGSTKSYNANTYNYASKGSYVAKYRCYENDLKAFKTIIFYEWSDINGNKLHFKNLEEFYIFLDECKIPIPNFTICGVLEKNKICHVMCKSGTTNLIVADTKENLIKEIKK